MLDKPDFLDLADREPKPRCRGLTHVLDKGVTTRSLEALLHQSAEFVDVLKIGWGIAYLDPTIKERVALCNAAGVAVCLGGTLLEICAAQGRVPQLREWAKEIGVDAIEVSNGLAGLTPARKHALVAELSEEFEVLAETGAKDGQAVVDMDQWIGEMQADLAAGAWLVIAEGRESGTVGLYRPDGTPKAELIDAIVDRVHLDKVIFEAPTKAQQTWFIRRFGPNVGLGNVGTGELLALETLRRGLRADTADVKPVEPA